MELINLRKELQNRVALRKRLIFLTSTLKQGVYPISVKMFGFPDLNIESEQELSGRIKELQNWLLMEAVEA